MWIILKCDHRAVFTSGEVLLLGEKIVALRLGKLLIGTVAELRRYVREYVHDGIPISRDFSHYEAMVHGGQVLILSSGFEITTDLSMIKVDKVEAADAFTEEGPV